MQGNALKQAEVEPHWIFFVYSVQVRWDFVIAISFLALYETVQIYDFERTCLCDRRI